MRFFVEMDRHSFLIAIPQQGWSLIEVISLTHPDVSKRVQDLLTEAYRESAALKLIESPKVRALFLFVDHVVGLFPCSISHIHVALLGF